MTPEEWRVVLKDRTATARVVAGADVREDVPIVTARRGEDAKNILAAVAHDAVLLQEDAAVAMVKLQAVTREDVPIYKERMLDAATGAAEMVRVKVHEIRVRGEAPRDAPAEAGTSEKRRFGLFGRRKQGAQ